jgi:YegS/Rv2252/BmrU family lipid kinase
MAMQRILVFANPIAGQGKGQQIARQVQAELMRRGYQADLFLSRMDQAQVQGPPADVRAAVVIGGDGTLRAVAQWAVDSEHPSLAIPYPLLIVPMGTANLMGQHLGIRWDEKHLGQQVCDAIEHGHVTYLDVARTSEGIFLLMAGVGFDAAVVHELARVRRGPISKLKYVLPILRTFWNYRFPRLTATVDGQRVFGPARGLALAGNVPEYGLGFPLLPQAKPNDQLLDVCVMPCASRRDLIRLLLAAATQDHVREEGVVYLKGRSIRIESPEAVPVQVDGEAAGFTPLEIDLLPGRIPFIVPTRYE